MSFQVGGHIQAPFFFPLRCLETVALWISCLRCTYCAVFSLTCQKWFVSFVNETNRQTDLKCCSSWVPGKKSFSSRPPKTALNSDFFPFYLTERTSDLHLVLEAFIWKDCVKELCKKSIEKIMWNSAYA